MKIDWRKVSEIAREWIAQSHPWFPSPWGGWADRESFERARGEGGS